MSSPLLAKIMTWTQAWLSTRARDAHISYRFQSTPPWDKDAYWTRLLPLIAPRDAVAIIGFDDPYPHWTVATNKSGPFSVRLFCEQRLSPAGAVLSQAPSASGWSLRGRPPR